MCDITLTEESCEAMKRRSQWLSSRYGRVHSAVAAAATFLLLCGTAVVALCVATCTLFRKRRLYSEVLARWLAATILRVQGVTLVSFPQQTVNHEQKIYVFNHTSTLDMFILLSLGLPSTRYFMRGRLRAIIPLGIITYLMGTFFTPSQADPAARVLCFKNAERVLRRTGDSVCLSPEGTRVTSSMIGAFNKGAFHLATALKVPIVPLFIDIPLETNPGKGWGVVPGTVHVHLLPEIRTDAWRLEKLDEQKEQVRSVYVRFQEELRSAALSTPSLPAAPAVVAET
jgi:1-acyl-sn-glycerol-3-phosphate acyltransferase